MFIEATKQELLVRGGWLDKLMETIGDSAILFDEDFRVIHCSKSTARFNGLSQEEMIGLHISKTDKLSHSNHQEFYDAFHTGTTQKNVMTTIRSKPAISTVIPIKENDKVIATLGIIFIRGNEDLKRILAQTGSVLNVANNNAYTELSRKNLYTFDDFVGESPLIKEVISECKLAANTRYPILLIGETGTGKEILASAIHGYNQSTSKEPYVKVNCTAIPESLIESELFGYEKGAFTGANTSKKGKFELAGNGTILLDEIGDMEFGLQSKLLRVLEEKEFEHVGGTKLIPQNARIIVSTNKDLKKLSAANEFRLDLYYRLNTFEIKIPPLRERKEDIPILIDHICEDSKYKLHFSKSSIALMTEYNWPGNVRQLKSVLQRFSVTKNGCMIVPKDLLKILSPFDHGNTLTSGISNNSALKTADWDNTTDERGRIIAVLKANNMNIKSTSAALGVSTRTLYNKLHKYNISFEKNISLE